MLATEQMGTARDYEAIYAGAAGDHTAIPWADGRPHPALVTWLNATAPSLIRCGARVVVVGCGLGDDARELLRRGYDVTAFDLSPTAIDWARRLDPAAASCFSVADLFALPDKWRHRFDLVVEINTIQALPPDTRADTVRAVAELLAPHGYMLVVCRGAEEPVGLEGGPPWALTEGELQEAAAAAELKADSISVFLDNGTPPVRRMRAVYRRQYQPRARRPQRIDQFINSSVDQLIN